MSQKRGEQRSINLIKVFNYSSVGNDTIVIEKLIKNTH